VNPVVEVSTQVVEEAIPGPCWQKSRFLWYDNRTYPTVRRATSPKARRTSDHLWKTE
jgi:hypothetical protein